MIAGLMVLAVLAAGAVEPPLCPAQKLADSAFMASLTAPGDDATRWDTLKSVWEAGKDSGMLPVKKVRLPLDYYASGRIRVMLIAQEAWLNPTNAYLLASGVELRQLSERGKLEGMIEAEHLVVDRNARIGRAFGTVSLTSELDTMTGQGGLFDLKTRYVRILSDACLTTRRFGNAFAMKGMFEAKTEKEEQ